MNLLFFSLTQIKVQFPLPLWLNHRFLPSQAVKQDPRAHMPPVWLYLTKWPVSLSVKLVQGFRVPARHDNLAGKMYGPWQALASSQNKSWTRPNPINKVVNGYFIILFSSTGGRHFKSLTNMLTHRVDSTPAPWNFCMFLLEKIFRKNGESSAKIGSCVKNIACMVWKSCGFNYFTSHQLCVQVSLIYLCCFNFAHI